MAKTRPVKKAQKESEKKSPKTFWKGSISFGLVNIPVALHSAESNQKVSFRLLDRRDLSPVRYQRVNEHSGKQVSWDEIVKGYEYDKGEYVVLSDADFERANVEATHTIEIVAFVDLKEISPMFFHKPYYLAPLKHGEKGYALLREVMRRTGKAGIARVVLRSREYLAAVTVHGEVMVLNLLRFAHELRGTANLEVPGHDLKRLKINEREIEMAQQLVEAMQDSWRPEQFHEQYRDDLMKIIDAKIKSGKTQTIDERGRAPAVRASKVVDITKLLKRSVDEAQREGRRRAS
jgi:DNA end-binding protein Ku